MVLLLLFTHFVYADEGFSGSISLIDAERGALAKDLTLKQSEQELTIAKKELENCTKTLEIGGSGSVNNTNTPLGNAATTSISGILNLNPQWSIYANTTGGSNLVDKTNQAGISYAPFEFKQLIDIKQKEYDLSVKTSTFETAKIQLIINVRIAYAEVIQKKKLLQFANENSQLAEAHLKKTQALFESGKIPRIDLLEAEQKNRAAQLGITSAQLALDSALLQLNQLTGISLSKDTLLDEKSLTWSRAGQINVDATVAACTGADPELQAAIKLIENNELLNKVADLQWATGWSLSLGQEWKTTGGSGSESQTFSITVKGSPIFSQSWKGKKEIAALNLEKSKTAKTDLLAKTVNDLKNAWNMWKIAENNLIPKDEAIDLAKERLRLTTLKFENGMASAADVNNDRESLAQVEEDYWNVWLDMQNAREKFYRLAWGKPVLMD